MSSATSFYCASLRAFRLAKWEISWASTRTLCVACRSAQSRQCAVPGTLHAREMFLTDTESFFDSLVTDAANRRRTPAECLSVCQRSHPELVEALRLALALRFV